VGEEEGGVKGGGRKGRGDGKGWGGGGNGKARGGGKRGWEGEVRVCGRRVKKDEGEREGG